MAPPASGPSRASAPVAGTHLRRGESAPAGAAPAIAPKPAGRKALNGRKGADPMTPPTRSGVPAADILARIDRYGLRGIVDEACASHGATPLEVCSGSRSSRVSRARHAVWAAIRERRLWSLCDIGALFDCDHTSVSVGSRKARERG